MAARKKTTSTKRPKRPSYALKIEVEGPGVHKKSIAIPELVKICSAIQSAVHRQAEAMEKPSARTLRTGPITAIAQHECTLELTGVVSGSTGLVFRYAKPQQPLPLPDSVTFGADVLARVADVVSEFATKKAPETDVDPGVLASLQELGGVLQPTTITRISLKVPHHNGRKRYVTAVLTQSVRERIAERIKVPTQEHRTIEGKLEMADFKETGRACRIHPSVGLPVECSFDPEIEEQVYAALRKPARISGLAKLNPHSGNVEDLKIEEIEPMDELLLGGRDFLASRTLEQLAETQGVAPIDKPSDLAGGWPPDESIDEFLSATYLTRS